MIATIVTIVIAIVTIVIAIVNPHHYTHTDLLSPDSANSTRAAAAWRRTTSPRVAASHLSTLLLPPMSGRLETLCLDSLPVLEAAKLACCVSKSFAV